MIFIGGLLISAGILMSTNLTAAQSSTASQASQWTQNAGAGISVPACGSSSNLEPTCTGASPSVTISWTWTPNTAHPRECNLANVGIYQSGVQIQGYQRACNDGITWTGGESNTPYTYNAYFIDVDGNPPIETASGSFSTPNCAPPPPPPPPPPLPQPDLVIQFPSLSPESPLENQAVTFRGTLLNQGGSVAGASDTRLRIDLNNNGWIAGEPEFINPAGAQGIGGTEGQSFTPWPAVLGTHSYQICADSGNVVAESDEGNNCSASQTFIVTAITYTVTASINSRSGTITGPDISCPGDCSESYPSGTAVTLIATPSAGYAFSSWTGACAGQTSSCSIPTMDANKVTAVNFSVVPPFDYSLSDSGNSNVTKSGVNESTTNTITKTRTSGATQSVALSVSGQPAGVTVGIANQGCSPDCTSIITFTVPPSTPVGTYPITVTGSPLGKQTNFNLVISGSPFSVSCLASPSPALLGQTVTWTAMVVGGVPPFTYSWSGTNIPTSPAPNTNPFSIVYSTIGQKTATVIVTDTDSVSANCPVSTVRINFDPDFEEF
ncbi:MAG: hypothetical protein UY36_C0013G0003 [Parcubacteria group bacterium GW2011_GWA1_49_11]|nr:MAG: hypothetical protein UY36_C0013G0003 [Parcubacteria group bacterium GW2011_GWA1_49_11]